MRACSRSSRPASSRASPTAAPKEPIDELFDAATACVENGKVNRGCDGYAKLSAFVNQQRREPALVGKLVTQAEGKDAARRALVRGKKRRCLQREPEARCGVPRTRSV